MAGTVPVLTYLPIDTYGTTDTANVPKLDIMRGDITPAIFDSSLDPVIVNTPTPFYMLCTAKVFNGYTQINTIVKNSILQEAYQQFGVTQGSSTYYPGTNANNSNAQDKRNFYLNMFQSSFLKDATSTSPGLLVPMYCGYHPTKGFYFFRADVFFDTTTGAPSSQDQLPEKPIAYGSPGFPNPIGKTASQLYHLASVYTNSTYDQNRIGTWSAFLTNKDIFDFFVLWSNFENGPLAAKVYIKFNIPTDNAIVQTPVSKISSSEIYTVIDMYQDSTATLKTGGSIYPDFLLEDYTTLYPSPPLNPAPNLGYPLNFLYAVGGNYYKSMTGITPPVVYQNQDKSYLGNFTQSGTGGWSPANTAYLYQGKFNSGSDNTSFVFQTSYTRGLQTTNTEYKCFCAGNGRFNGTCFAGGGATSGITSNGPLAKYSTYYKLTCNTVHAGTWQFLAYQFIPLNFYNPPPKTLVPQILPALSIDDQITLPNKAGGPNQWPTGGLPPNTITNLTISDTLYNWLENPINFYCGDIVNSFPYCGFSDYYLSLMRVFYDKGECGDYYDPPNTNVPPVVLDGKAYFFSDSCFDGTTKGLCVPNYQYLLDPTASGTTLTILNGNPQIINNTSVNMLKVNDAITTVESFDTTDKSIYVSMVLSNTGNAVFEIGITNEHTTRISQGILTPFGSAFNNVAYRSGQILKIEYLNDIVKTANVYLDGVKISTKTGYTQGPNQKLYFKYVSAISTASYKFTGIFFGETNGSLIKPFQCLRPVTKTDPDGIFGLLTIGAGTPTITGSVTDNYEVTMKTIGDLVITSNGFNLTPNPTQTYVALTMTLPSITASSTDQTVFEVGITDEHTTEIRSGFIYPFGKELNKIAYRPGQILQIRYLNDIAKTAILYLNGIRKASITGYTQGTNEKFYFEYISTNPTAEDYLFSEVSFGNGSVNGVETIRVSSVSSPYYQDVVKDVITWQNLENYIFSYPQNVVPNNQVTYQPAPALPQNVVNSLNGNNPTSGSTTPKSSSGNIFLIIGIVIAIIIIGLIIFFIVRSNKNRTQEKKIQISPYTYRVV